MTALRRHALSAAWGDMPEAELQELTDDIEVNGQREPIVLYEGQVLDGWHRYSACQSLGIECDRTDLPDGEDAVSWVISRNARRRSLTGSQKALAIVACHEWAPDGRPENREPGSRLPMKNAEMAAEAGVSEKTIKQAKTVQTKASKAVKDAVQKGEVSVKRASEVAKLPKKEQAAALKEKPPVRETEPAPAVDSGDGQDASELLDDMQKDLRRAEAVAAEFEAAMKADDIKAPLAAAIRRAEHSERRQGELMEDAVTAKKRADFYERQLARCGKAVGVRDLDKVAPAVEALARRVKEPA
jgi:hypothetical protein